MTGTIGYADPEAAAPTLASFGVPVLPDAREQLLTRVRLAAALPLLVSLAVHLVFFVSFWIPETDAFPAHDWWLTQLSPLASAAVTSAGRAPVDVQQDQLGIGAELLLLCAAALLVLARHPRRFGQRAVLAPAALGTVVGLAVVVAVLLGARPGEQALGVVLVAVWIGAAGYAGIYSLLLDLDLSRRRRWRNGVPMLAAYAVVAPAPTAVGRALFGLDLRDVAATLQANTVALRLSALNPAPTLLLYLAGILVGVSVWLAYQCWPLRRDTTMLTRVALLVLALIATAGVGNAAAEVAQRRAEQLRTESPAQAIRFSCGSAELATGQRGEPQGGGPQRSEPPGSGQRSGPPGGGQRTGGPARTLVITGLTCRGATTFEGYRQLSTQSLPDSVSPVTVRTPDGHRLTGRVVSAQYGDVVVFAATSRLDTGADRLFALRVEDGAVLWQFSCGTATRLRLRFARVPGGDDPRRGYLTEGERRPQVVTRCGDRTLRLDPATGLTAR